MPLDRRKYRELFGILKDAVEEAGYRVVVSYTTRARALRQGVYAFGYVDEDAKILRLRWISGMTCEAKICAFAHEARHVQHAVYRERAAQLAAYDSGDAAWAAVVEADCEAWAAKFCATYGVVAAVDF